MAEPDRGNAARSVRSYLFVERLPDGALLKDRFDAAGDAEALRRVADVIDCIEAELWRDEALVWRGAGASSAVAEAIMSLSIEAMNGNGSGVAPRHAH